MKELESASREELIQEYGILVDLYIHEDNLAFKIMESSVVLNSALAAVIKFGPSSPITNIVFAVIGLAICVAWRQMTVSSTNHHDLRAFRARAIEARLGRRGTFHDEKATFYHHEPIEFYDLFDVNKPQVFKPVKTQRAFLVLERLPFLVGAAWLFFIAASIAQLAGLI